MIFIIVGVITKEFEAFTGFIYIWLSTAVCGIGIDLNKNN
jgi:hypothetical protein